jgi:hypothetical protein
MMNSYAITGALIHENTSAGIIVLVFGIFFLFFGAWLYYSAIRLFGSVTGGIVGILICHHVIQAGASPSTTTFTYILYALSGLFGILIGGSLSLVFHYAIFFIAGALISMMLYEIFSNSMALPQSFTKLSLNSLIDELKPDKSPLKAIVMIVGGIIYMSSAHILIVITMSVVGSYMIAYSLNQYYLFPILSVMGSIVQYMITRKRRIVIRRYPG